MRDHQDQSVSARNGRNPLCRKKRLTAYTTSDDEYTESQMKLMLTTTVVDEYFDLGEATFMARSTYHTDTGSF